MLVFLLGLIIGLFIGVVYSSKLESTRKDKHLKHMEGFHTHDLRSGYDLGSGTDAYMVRDGQGTLLPAYCPKCTTETMEFIRLGVTRCTACEYVRSH